MPLSEAGTASPPGRSRSARPVTRRGLVCPRGPRGGILRGRRYRRRRADRWGRRRTHRGTQSMSRLDREVNDALQRAQADDLGQPRARFVREPEPLPGGPDWGPLSFLQPATPWHLVGIGVALALVGRLLGRVPPAGLLLYLGVALLVIGVASLLVLRREPPKRW